MTVRTLLLGLVAGAVCISCGSDAQQGGASSGRSGDKELRVVQAPVTPSAGATASHDPYGAAGSPGAPATIGGGGSPVASSIPSSDAAPIVKNESEMLLAPKDARWTIFCATIGGDDHMSIAKELKKSLIQRTGMRDWNLVSEEGQSRLYYGFYRTINDPADPAESKRAREDRKRIDEFADAAGERPFQTCQFVQLSAPDPESPPEWNLANVPEDKVWTLLIGAYKDHPDRKRAAVESVRDARANGEEAYYYHGDSVSNVFVGAWPEEAVIEEKVDARDGVRAQDPLLVLPPGMKVPEGKVTRNGQAIRAVGQQLVPVDEVLKQKIAQYPHMGVNGETLVYKHNGRKRIQGPVITPIPRPSETPFGPGSEDEAQAAGDGLFGYDRADFSTGSGAATRSPGRSSPSAVPSDSSADTSVGTPARRLRSVGDQ